MANCTICAIPKKAENGIAVLKVEDGLAIVPEDHFAILEQTPDSIVQKMFVKANIELLQIFESGVQGANMLIHNGVTAGQQLPHVVLHLMERSEGDNKLQVWQPKQIPEEAMNQIEERLREAMQSSDEQPAIPKEAQKQEIKKDDASFIRKHFRRVP